VLGPLEERVRAASLDPTLWEALTNEDLFLWVSKFIYGVVYREAFLAMDRTDPAAGPIASEEFLEQLRTVHFFLQGVRWPIRFVHYTPGSIFRVHFVDDDPDLPNEAFWHHDNPFSLTMAMRTGPVGLITALQDNGAIAELFEPVQRRLDQQPLTHLQFIELAAQMSYIRLQLNRTTKYIMVEAEDGIDVIPMPLAGMSRLPIFDQGLLRDYAVALAAFLGWSLTEVMPEDGRVISFFDPDSGMFPLGGIINPASGLVRPRS
jgi:hypothetical protein